jgi:hypothetical protein
MVSGLEIGPGDSIHVFESNRHTVLAPEITELAYVRMLPVAPWHVAFLRDGRMVAQRMIAGADGVGQPLHVIDAAGTVMHSMGGSGPWNQRRIYAGVFKVAPASDGGVWAAPIGEYRIDHWTPEGIRGRSVVPEAEWFPPWGATVEDFREAARHPRIADLHEDAWGRLWVAIRVPADDAPPREPSRGEVRVEDVDPSAEDDTVIEVVDPRTGGVIARSRFEPALARFTGDGSVLHASREDADGSIVIDLWRARLVGEARSGAP